jgi:hypothetical protein
MADAELHVGAGHAQPADGDRALPRHRRGDDEAKEAPRSNNASSSSSLNSYAGSSSALRLPSRDEKVHVQNFIQNTQAFRGERLFGYVDAVYSIAATVMVVPTVSTSTTITTNTTYLFAAQVPNEMRNCICVVVFGTRAAMLHVGAAADSATVAIRVPR